MTEQISEWPFACYRDNESRSQDNNHIRHEIIEHRNRSEIENLHSCETAIIQTQHVDAKS